MHIEFCVHLWGFVCLYMLPWRDLQFIIPLKGTHDLNEAELATLQSTGPWSPSRMAGDSADVASSWSATGSAFIDKDALYRQELFLVLHLHLSSWFWTQCCWNLEVLKREECLYECDFYPNFILMHKKGFVAKQDNKVLVLNVDIFPLNQRE